MASNRVCSIRGCDKKVHAHDLCNTHYYRFRKHGDPEKGARTPLGMLPQFVESALAWDSDECLFWPFGKNNQGYGILNVEGRSRLAHRSVCCRAHGPAPTPQHEAAHSCGNGHLGCVNPRHLRWATRAENEADKIIHGTLRRGEDCNWARLSEVDVREIRSLRGKIPQKSIAAKFGIDYRRVWEIQTRKRWAWLE